MKKARYLIEFGQGVDLHGENATKAASKAILNAMSHCCMCGTTEIPAACGKKGALEILIQVGVPPLFTLCFRIKAPRSELRSPKAD